MPTKNAVVIQNIRGEDAYEAFLKRLEKAVVKAGVPIEGRRELVVYALSELARVHGLKAPRVSAAHGTNRYGEPGDKAD